MRQALYLVNDCAALANYAGTIAGTLNITAVSVVGNQMTCSYTVTSGSAPQAGCRVMLNMAKAANCGIFVILAGGIGTGTFTVTNNSAVAVDTGTAYLVNARYTITTVANVAGNTWRYTYTLLEGSQPYTTDTAIINACQNTGNNGSFAVTAVNNANKTFDVTNASGVAESGSSGYAALSGAPVGPSIAGGVHQGLLSVGLLPTADLNQMNWSAVIAVGISQTTGSQPRGEPIVLSWVNSPAAWSNASVSYTGVAVNGTGAPSMVYQSGMLWACISTNTSSPTNGPNMAGGTNNWTPYNLEVWQTTGAVSVAPNSAPIYWRIIHSSDYSSNCYDPYWKIGTLTTGTGDITGVFGYIQVTNPEGSVSNLSSATNRGSSLFECNFFSDGGDTLGMFLWRTLTNNGDCIGVFLDRARDNGGNMLPTYFGMWIAAGHPGNAFTSGPNMVVFFSGGSVPTAGTIATVWNTIAWPAGNGVASTAGAFQGLTPASPIFPVIGYIGNPFLVGVALKQGDCSDGQLVNVVLYNASHTFLVSKSSMLVNPLSAAFGSSNFAMRWE